MGGMFIDEDPARREAGEKVAMRALRHYFHYVEVCVRAGATPVGNVESFALRAVQRALAKYDAKRRGEVA